MYNRNGMTSSTTHAHSAHPIGGTYTCATLVCCCWPHHLPGDGATRKIKMADCARRLRVLSSDFRQHTCWRDMPGHNSPACNRSASAQLQKFERFSCWRPCMLYCSGHVMLIRGARNGLWLAVRRVQMWQDPIVHDCLCDDTASCGRGRRGGKGRVY